MNSTLPLLRLELRPTRRNEVTDLTPRLAEAVERGELPSTKHLLCISHHTTAGFPDRRLRLRLGSDPERLSDFLAGLREVFPPLAGYQHDRLEERQELSAAQRALEPLNADAHLAFIGGGFTNTLLHRTEEGEPIWFVDFDGTWETRERDVLRRTRRVTVIGLEGEVEEARLHFRIPVPQGAGAVPLGHRGSGVLAEVERALGERDLRLGRVRFRVEDSPPGTGVTVNEAEALLVQRDLVDLLSQPLRYAGSRGLPRVLEALRFSPARQERLAGRARASASPRILRIRREASLAVAPEGEGAGAGRLVLGRYQSPILLQREGTPEGSRTVSATLYRFL